MNLISCPICGATVASRRGGPRYCSRECRRAGYALHQQQHRARQSLVDPAFAPARAAYNRARLAVSPEARAAKRRSDRTYAAARRRDPEFVDAERQRWADYYRRVGSKMAYRERQRQRMAETRRRQELDLMRQDMDALEENADDNDNASE